MNLDIQREHRVCVCVCVCVCVWRYALAILFCENVLVLSDRAVVVISRAADVSLKPTGLSLLPW